VQLHPGRQDHLVGLGDGVVVTGQQRHLGRLGPTDGVHVAQAPPPVLQVGLEQEGDLARVAVPLLHPDIEGGQPPLRALAPQRQALVGQVGREGLVTDDVPGRQDGGGGVEVVGSQRQRLLHGAHGVTELQALVPDRVPEGLGQRRHVDAGLVQQVEVDVAAR
jgi:hypothetical protein